jgi:hypothetical protein
MRPLVETIFTTSRTMVKGSGCSKPARKILMVISEPRFPRIRRTAS